MYLTKMSWQAIRISLTIYFYVCVVALCSYNIYRLHEVTAEVEVLQSEIVSLKTLYDAPVSEAKIQPKNPRVLSDKKRTDVLIYPSIANRYRLNRPVNKRQEDKSLRVRRDVAVATQTEPNFIIQLDHRFTNDDSQVRHRNHRKPQCGTNRKPAVLGSLHLHYAHSTQQRTPILSVTETELPLGPWTPHYQASVDHGLFSILNDSSSVVITVPGLYWLYSQFTYFDRTGRWAHSIDVNGQMFIKCVSADAGLTLNTENNIYITSIHHCYTAAPRYLLKDDTVTIHSLYMDRNVTLDTKMTFWGVLKLT